MKKIYFFLFNLFFKSLRIEMANALMNTISIYSINYQHIYLYTHDGKVKGYLDLGVWHYTISPRENENEGNNRYITSDKKYVIHAFFYN